MSVVSLGGRFVRVRPLLGRYGVWFWIVALSVFAGAFALKQRGEIGRIGDVLGSIDPRWLFGILLCQSIAIGLTALAYQSLLRRLGHRVPWLSLYGIHLQRHVVGTVTPIGGPASVYVFLRALNRHGVASSDGLLVAALRSLTGYASFVALLLPSLVLFRPAGFLLVGALALLLLLGLMLVGMSLLLRGQGLAPWVARRLPARAAGFVERARSHGIRPRDLAVPFGLALLSNLANAAMLALGLLALGERTSLLTPVIGYAVGNLFLLVAPVFQGIGVVELSMALALQQLGISGTTAVGATLLFRLGDLWWPLALGVTAQAALRPSRLDRALLLGRAPAVALGGLGLVTAGSALIARAPMSLPVLSTAARQFQGSASPVVAIWLGVCCLIVSYGLWRGGTTTRLATYATFGLVPGLFIEQLFLLVSFWPL